MPIKVLMPRLGGSFSEATIVEWLRKEGDWVEEYDPLLQVDTGKLGSDIPSPAAGILRQLMVSKGQSVRPGALLALIYDPEEAFADSLDQESEPENEGDDEENDGDPDAGWHPVLPEGTQSDREEQHRDDEEIKTPMPDTQPVAPDEEPPDVFDDFISFEGYEPALETAPLDAEAQATQPPLDTPPQEKETLAEEPANLDLPPFLRSYLNTQGASLHDEPPITAGPLNPSQAAEKKVIDLPDFLRSSGRYSSTHEAAQKPEPLETSDLSEPGEAVIHHPFPISPINADLPQTADEPDDQSLPDQTEPPAEMIDTAPSNPPENWNESSSQDEPRPIDDRGWMDGGEFQDGDLLTPISPRRRTAGEQALLGHQSIPMATTLMEADLRHVVAHHEEHRAAYARDGAHLSYPAYFVAALVAALKEYPILNASWGEDGIRIHTHINIGLQMATQEEGMAIAVLRDCDGLSLLGLARAIEDLSKRAEARRLNTLEKAGATFTLFHHTTSASLITNPTISLPQCALLSVGAIKKRPIIIDDAIAIRPMAYLSLAYDQRVVDHATANTFLALVLQTLEKWT